MLYTVFLEWEGLPSDSFDYRLLAADMLYYHTVFLEWEGLPSDSFDYSLPKSVLQQEALLHEPATEVYYMCMKCTCNRGMCCNKRRCFMSLSTTTATGSCNNLSVEVYIIPS
jgi:hypothetical protein